MCFVTVLDLYWVHGRVQTLIVDGDDYMEYIEMGGRSAREQLRMKLPEFAAAPKTVRRTDSLLAEVCAATLKAALANSSATHSASLR